ETDIAGEKPSKFRRPFFMSVAALLVVGVTHVALSVVGSSSAPRGDGTRQAAGDVAPPGREPAKSNNALPAANTTVATTENAATPPAPGSQLLAPSPVVNSPVTGASVASTGAAAPRQDGKVGASTSPWDVGVVADVTGSLAKP